MLQYLRQSNPAEGYTLMMDQPSADPNVPEFEWDLFLAHSSSDAEAAEQLYNCLTQRTWQPVRVFLDSRSLKLGDDWDLALAEAQRKSRVTVVLVSPQTQSAYYQREEVAAAISMAREAGSRHRVVPLFLGDAGRQTTIPYGLRLKHGLAITDASKLNLACFSLFDLVDEIRSIPDQIMSERVGMIEAADSNSLSLKTLAESTTRGSAAINSFVTTIESAFRSGARTLDFLSDRRERIRLRRLVQELMDIEYSQAPLPWLLRGYRRHEEGRDNWGQITSTIAELTPKVAKVAELLASSDGPFIVSARDAYKSLLFSLRMRSEVYARIQSLERPSSPKDYAYLEEIASQYEGMISDLRRAQEAITEYLST
jgi:hypothetical protein